MAQLLSVNVGLPREIEWRGKTVHTAVWKEPVRGRRKVGKLNIDGEGQGDLQGHGGWQRAVFVYRVQSYRYWEKQLGRKDFVFEQFGENFTIDGSSDDEVCIGDRYRIGSALFEVTQPRVTCYVVLRGLRGRTIRRVQRKPAGRALKDCNFLDLIGRPGLWRTGLPWVVWLRCLQIDSATQLHDRFNHHPSKHHSYLPSSPPMSRCVESQVETHGANA
jgi:hypothetical protein